MKTHLWYLLSCLISCKIKSNQKNCSIQWRPPGALGDMTWLLFDGTAILIIIDVLSAICSPEPFIGMANATSNKVHCSNPPGTTWAFLLQTKPCLAPSTVAFTPPSSSYFLEPPFWILNLHTLAWPWRFDASFCLPGHNDLSVLHAKYISVLPSSHCLHCQHLLDIAFLQTALPASSLILSNPGSIWQAVIVSKCKCDHVTVLP